MFRFIVAVAVIASAVAFAPARMSSRTQTTMVSEKPDFGKMIGAAFIASTVFAGSAMAKDGAGAKQSFFGDDSYSSPYTINEQREDAIYSPYSPYGDGSKSVYNTKFNADSKEIAFWKNKFLTAEKRVNNVPKFTEKKEWANVLTELKSYAYNMRESMLRLAKTSSDPAAATAIAKSYFVDLNDMDEWAVKKNGAKVSAAYDQSVKDITAFKALLK